MSHRTDAGFSLIELLVATTLTAIVLAATATFFVSTRDFVQAQTLRIETEQAVRSTLDALSRDLRLGGACLPQSGAFIPLEGSESTVVTRAGLVRDGLVCVRTALAKVAASAAEQLDVESTEGFAEDMWAYIRHPNGTGEFFVVTHVDTGTKTLSKTGHFSQDYPAGCGIYAVDEREYAIDTTNPDLPVLTISVNGGAPVAFASGVETLHIQYQLVRHCPPCDVVDLPANNAEWSLVNKLFVGVTARSSRPGRDGQYYRRTGQIDATPRNLLPR